MSSKSGSRHSDGLPHGGPDGIHTAEHLIEHLKPCLTPSTIVICIGNDLCGDDGAGPAVARELAGKVPWDVLDAQSVPESFLMKIVRKQPESVVLVDALDFGAEGGSVEVFESERISGQGPSTHGPAPLAFLDLLAMMHPCRCAVVGIQPRQVDPGTGLSQDVAAAVRMVAEAFLTAARHS
jgi:hydrogenase 3 maturation protease